AEPPQSEQPKPATEVVAEPDSTPAAVPEPAALGPTVEAKVERREAEPKQIPARMLHELIAAVSARLSLPTHRSRMGSFKITICALEGGRVWAAPEVPPLVFTGQGAIMAGTVLNSLRAVARASREQRYD